MKKDLVCINVGRHFGWETKRTKSHMWDGIDDKKSSWAVCLENEIIFHHRMDFAKHITRFFGETGMLWLPAGPACHRPAWLPLHTLMLLYTTYTYSLSFLEAWGRFDTSPQQGCPKSWVKTPFVIYQLLPSADDVPGDAAKAYKDSGNLLIRFGRMTMW